VGSLSRSRDREPFAIVEPVGKPCQFSLLIVVATQCWTACGSLLAGERGV
jgi:hypothetical protein